MSLESNVLTWAQGKLGQKVGHGECWDLADQALRHAGARSSTTTGPQDDYDWGTPVGNLHAAQGGYILQFRNWRAVITEEGEGWSAEGYQERGSPNHTAIVERVLPYAVVVLEQNINHVHRVTRAELCIFDGTFERHHVTRHDDATDSELHLDVTQTVHTQGQIRCYRPVAAT